MLMCALSEPICTRKMLFVVVLARAGLSAPWFTEAVSEKTSSVAHPLDVVKCAQSWARRRQVHAHRGLALLRADPRAERKRPT